MGTDHLCLLARIKLRTRWSKSQKEKQKHKMWKIHLFKEASIQDTNERRIAEYLKDCPSNENIEEEGRLMSEILNKMAKECVGTKSKTKKKKCLYVWNS
jgi:hypothetical protein